MFKAKTIEEKELETIQRHFEKLLSHGIRYNIPYLAEICVKGVRREGDLRALTGVVLTYLQKERKGLHWIKKVRRDFLLYSTNLPLVPTRRLFAIKSGDAFGEWEVLDKAKKRKDGNYWNCLCSCNTVKEVSEYALKNGLSKSCGCRGKGEDDYVVEFPLSKGIKDVKVSHKKVQSEEFKKLVELTEKNMNEE